MKTFFTVVGIAVLAILVVEISQINAQRERRCRNRPPLNETEVQCDRPSRDFRDRLRLAACIVACRQCYNSSEIIRRRPGCLVEKNCTCLAKGDCEDVTGGSDIPTTDSSGDATTQSNGGGEESTQNDEGNTEQSGTEQVTDVAGGGDDQSTSGNGQGDDQTSDG